MTSNESVACPRAADIILALDESTSIVVGRRLRDSWHVAVLGFAKSVIRSFPIGRRLTRVGVEKFSDDAHVVIHLDDYDDRDSLLAAVDRIGVDGGETNLAAALRVGRAMLNRSDGARDDRGGVPKILVVLSDGAASRETTRTADEADATKAAGIVIFTVGVGYDVCMRCHLIFSHLRPYLFSVNAYKHFYSGNHFLILYCDATTPLWSL